MDKKLIGGIAAGAVILITTAAVSSYVTRERLEPETPVVTAEPKIRTKTHAQAARPQQYQQVAAAQPAQPACDDSNILGTVAGGVAGGVLGAQIGNGNGKTAAAIGGTLGGAYLGSQYIPLKNVTCRH